MTALTLTEEDRATLEGERGDAAAMAMRLVVAAAEMVRAGRLLSVSRAHIDGCLYHGQAGLDFIERLVELGARVTVPTTLNVTSLDLLHPDLYRGDPDEAVAARRQMDAYVSLGCRPTWTCAPYLLPDPPAFGEQIAWGESNAIVYANSVLGARTERYGDFLDICAAITGRVPAAGLHLDGPRRPDCVFDVSGLPARLLSEDVLFPLLGLLIGADTARLGYRVPAVVGLADTTTEDQLRALGAAAASSGSVGLFHAPGITPEIRAEPLDLDGLPQITIRTEQLIAVRDELSGAEAHPVGAVAVGTPHASMAEMREIARLLAERPVADGLSFYLSTARAVLEAAASEGVAAVLEAAGITIVTDTCTYLTPIIDTTNAVMTNSAKWAFYAPGNIGAEVVFGSTAECVETAVAGDLRRDGELWHG